jgi:hypothetical protein
MASKYNTAALHGKGYTWNFSAYSGKEGDNMSVPTKVITELSHSLLGHGWTIVTDHYYSSYSL